MADELRWDSNNQRVADRELFHGRVRDGALEICPDPKTGAFVGVHLARTEPPTEDPEDPEQRMDFSAIAPTDWVIDMADGPIDAASARLIPNPYPYPDQDGNDPRMYDMVVNGGPYTDQTFTFDPDLEESIALVSGPFTVNVGYWGFCFVRYDDSDAAQMPADTVSNTILTISYRVSNVAGDVISDSFGPVDIKITGDTPDTDVTPPTVLSVLPAGLNVGLDSTITINASEEVVEGTGNFYIYDEDAAAVHETIAASAAVYNATQITLTPTVAQDNSTNYSLRWDAGAFEDTVGWDVAAQADDTYTWRTVAASGGGGGPVTADVTVSSLAALTAQLDDWEANWNSTTPSGKTNSDERVVALDANTTGHMNLSGYTFPQRVYVRHAGTWTADANGMVTCSVAHTGTGTMDDSTNLFMYLLEIRAPNNTNFSNGLFSMDRTTDCGIERCTWKGWPFTIDTTENGDTEYAWVGTGSTNLTVAHNAYFYFKDGFAKLFGTHTNMRSDGNMGNYVGGDDYTFGNGVQMVDFFSYANYFPRRRMMSGSAAKPNHNDGHQFNKHTSGTATPATRYRSQYDVFLRGLWGGAALVAIGESGWGAYWTRDSQRTCVGPHSHDNCLLLNGHHRAITGFPGGNLTVSYCTAVQHDNDQPPNSAFPAIRNAGTAIANFSTGNNSSYNTIVGTGGLFLNIGGNATGVGANYSLLSPYFTTIPTNYTDLWDIRPPSGARTHPNHATPGDRVGCWGLWEKLFNGDADVVLSKVGVPVAPLFIADFDRSDNFWGGYTGTFDGDGNNA